MEVLGSMISLVFLASLCFGTTIEALQVNLEFSKYILKLDFPKYNLEVKIFCF